MTVRPIHTLLGIMLLYLTAAAAPFEGLTATYRDKESGDLLVVEVAADGRARITESDGSYSLIIGKQGYDVGPGPGGPLVVNYDVRAWLMAEDMRTGRVQVFKVGTPEQLTEPASAITPGLVAQGKRQIGSWQGTAFAPPGADYTSVVVSEDPQLAALGAPFGSYFVLVGKARPGGPDSDDPVLEEFLVGKGVLAFWNYELVRVEPGPIDPDRLALPAEPIELADVQTTPEADDDDLDAPFPVSAQFLGDRLLILSSEGTIAAWREDNPVPEAFAPPERAAMFCTNGAEAWLVTGRSRSAVTIWGGRPGAWRKLHAMTQGKGEDFGAIDCTGPDPVILTSKGIRNLRSGTLAPVTFPKGMYGGEPVTLQHGGFLYVGFNAGEWGGGLVRMPLAGGAGKALDQRDATVLCGGVQDMSCDPVTGLAPDPARPDCILVTTGLAHMGMRRGSVLRVCDEQFSIAYAKPYTMEPNWRFDPAAPLPASRNSVGFDGITHGPRGTWAVATDGYYRFVADPVPVFTPFPRRLDGFKGDVNWTNPDFVLVRTSKNQRHSLSGSSLMIVAR